MAVACLAMPGFAADYVELVPWSTVEAGSGGTTHFAAVVDGSTSYHQLRSSAAITQVDNLGGVQTSSVLMNAAQWFAATGETNLSTFYGFSVSGNYVQFNDTTTDQVWRVDRTTGAISAYATVADITALTGATGAQMLSPSDTAPSGEMAFYDGTSDSILVTNGANNVEYLVSAADLTAATGNSSVSGGLGYDASGNLYWGTNTSDNLWRHNTDGTNVEVLTTADITAVTGESSVGWKDIFPAPDGLVYFGETQSDSIMRFDPANAAGTLEIFLSAAQLEAGPMDSNNVICLTWYDGNLAFQRFNDYGLYVVPEPASLLLVVVAGALIRRR